jgi:deoxycytidylate deaminase
MSGSVRKKSQAKSAKKESPRDSGSKQSPNRTAKANTPTVTESPPSGSELVIGLVGAVGTELSKVVDYLEARLKIFGYQVQSISISNEVIKLLDSKAGTQKIENQKQFFTEVNDLMTAGDDARKYLRNDVLALGVASIISKQRCSKDKKKPTFQPRRAYIIKSLKHPAEVTRLREIYPQGFYLLGVYCDEQRRVDYLRHQKRISIKEARTLIERDIGEKDDWGQHVTDTFHMSDFFVSLGSNHDKLRESIWRILDILFGDAFKTPTFDEYAMFLAFAASLRSADLSRQVGAVITQGREIISTGANDCPRAGGGLHWPEFDPNNNSIVDIPGGRDHTRGKDSNKEQQRRLVNEILKSVKLKKEQTRI